MCTQRSASNRGAMDGIDDEGRGDPEPKNGLIFARQQTLTKEDIINEGAKGTGFWEFVMNQT